MTATLNHRYAVSLSAFDGDFSKHGGHRRSKQIETLVEEKMGYRFVSCPLDHSLKTPWRKKLKALKRVGPALTGWRTFSAFSPLQVLDEAANVKECERILNDSYGIIKEARTIIWENTMPNYLHMSRLLKKKYNAKLIACPHNLESLVPFQRQRWQGRDKHEYLKLEIEALRKCDHVFTIGEEEQWLLNLFGVQAHYLPYFPSGKLYNDLIALRGAREKDSSTEDYVLIVGSVNNPPTMAGMISLLNQLHSIISTGTQIPVVVTGFGTEVLKTFTSSHIKILGATHDLALHHLIRYCKAVVTPPGYSTGALTKITEFLLAGVPVITDEGGARSYRRYNGVHMYTSENQLKELLLSDLPIPTLPLQPRAQFDFFQQTLA